PIPPPPRSPLLPTRRSSDLGVDEHGAAARLEHPPRLAQKREGLGMHVEPVDAHHHVERAVASAGTLRELAVTERQVRQALRAALDRKSTRLNSSHVAISYAV